MNRLSAGWRALARRRGLVLSLLVTAVVVSLVVSALFNIEPSR